MASLVLAIALLALGGRGDVATPVASDRPSDGECACAAEALPGIAPARASAGDAWTTAFGDLAGEAVTPALVPTRLVAHSPATGSASPRRASRTLGGYLATAPPLSRTA